VHARRDAPAADTPVIGRAAIAATPTRGPLVVEEYDATVVVPADAAVHRDAFGTLRIALESDS
jgi:N-methylhydantoinase A